jgi:prolyl-tRNA synthetase
LRVSEYFIPTLRDVPGDAELASHRLLLRAGFVRQLGAGVYSFLPLGWRVVRKVEQVIREEMERIHCIEMRLPTLHPKELLEATGRYDVDVVYKLQDRRKADFALGFTHEEPMTDIVRNSVHSWRQLPLLLFQHQTKFRDEPRPRGGVIRTREFVMFDAYSFDRDEAGMDESFQKFAQAYRNVFQKMGVAFVEAEADGGDIGDLDNREFLVLSEAGEDSVLRCEPANFAANAEACAIPDVAPPAAANGNGGDKPLEIVSTPGARTIEEVAGMLGASPAHLVKTLIYSADGTPVAVLVRGDREVNEIKLRRYLKASKLELAADAVIEKVTGAPRGFAGPTGLSGVRIVADNEVRYLRNFITGANQADAHYVHVNIGRDFTPSEYADIRVAQAGDPCPVAPEHPLTEARGIEVGHIFKLGTKYSGPLGATYTDEQGQSRTIQMGSYGIGNSRMLAALVEASHDADGIIWHPSVAPFQVVIVVANVRDEAAMAEAERLHDALTARGIDVMLDDRDERPGVKFKDADLVGYPVRVVIGKGFAEGKVEVKARRAPKEGAREVPAAEAEETVEALLNELKGA